MKFAISLMVLLMSSTVWPATTRTIDADFLRSSDASKTYTLPSATDTLVGRTITETLTNKTLSGASNTFTQLPVAASRIQETPSGTVDGVNVTFTLSVTPASVTQVEVYVDGLLQLQGSGLDYTISTNTITFDTAPELGQTIRAVYARY